VEQAAGKSSRQVMRLLAEVDPELAAPADRVRPLGAGRWEIKAVIDDECRRGLERLKGLLSHVDPHMTLGQIVGRLVQEGLDRHDPARPPRGRRTDRVAGAERTSAKTQADSARGAASAAKQEARSDSAAPSAAKVSAQAAGQPGDDASPLQADRGPDRPDTSAAKPAGDATSAPKTRRFGPQAATCAKPAAPPRTQTSAAKAGGATGRAIPAAVKRAVWRRDRGRCSYVDRTSGRRCGSQHLLQIDHVVPYAQGGTAEPSNLRLLCAAHHRHRHAGAGFGRPARTVRRRFRSAPLPKAETALIKDRRDQGCISGVRGQTRVRSPRPSDGSARWPASGLRVSPRLTAAVRSPTVAAR